MAELLQNWLNREIELSRVSLSSKWLFPIEGKGINPEITEVMALICP
jgi:hypothetical protein